MAYEDDIKKLQQDQTLATSGSIGRTGAGFVDLISGQPITAASLTPATPLNPVIPLTQGSTIPNVDDFTPQVLGPKETEISRMIKDIQGIDVSGQTTFRAGEEQRLGMETLQKEEADLFATLKQQQEEFTNIQNERSLIDARMQQQAEGRGITAGGLAPLTAGELRKNALRASEIVARANTTAALLAGTQGKIMTANSLIERAVAQKYGALEEERNAKIANLNLLLKDPQLTIEQENRANKQLAYQNKQKEAEAKKKDDSQTIMKWALEAKQNGATALQAKELMNIGLSANPDLQKAFELFAPFSAKIEKLTGQSDFEQAFLRDKGRLPTVNELLDYKKREAAAGRTAAEGRDTEVSQLLESRKGTDGLVSASSYQEALRKFIANGGTQMNFIASFPQQTYLRQEEIDKLPVGLRQAQVAPVKVLTSDQQTMLNEAKATWDAAKQTYQATPELRQRVIDRAKELGFDISPYF